MRGPVLVVAGCAVICTLAGCGAPTSGQVTQLTAVPYDLMSPPTAASTEAPVEPEARPLVYLVREDVLVPVRASGVAGNDVATTLSALLAELTEGPDEEARDQGLSSALGPDAVITPDRLEGTRAVIDVQPGAQAPTAGRLPLAIGQIVLTVVSVPGVESVVFTAKGEPIQAPLPGGELTDRPLVASDYTVLTATSPTSSG